MGRAGSLASGSCSLNGVAYSGSGGTGVAYSGRVAGPWFRLKLKAAVSPGFGPGRNVELRVWPPAAG